MCLPTVSPSPCCNILYAIMRLMKCWTSPHLCLRTTSLLGMPPWFDHLLPINLCLSVRSSETGAFFWNLAQLFPVFLFPLSQLVWQPSLASNLVWPYRRINEGVEVKHEINCSNFSEVKGIKVAHRQIFGTELTNVNFTNLFCPYQPICYYFRLGA